MPKILIVEDQSATLELLEFAINKVMFLHYRDFSKGEYDITRHYNDAKEKILKKEYEILFLDHRIPYENQGDLEETDFKKFSQSLENIGYDLISKIKSKNPNAIIIGTSSISELELKNLPKPDFIIKKTWENALSDLYYKN